VVADVWGRTPRLWEKRGGGYWFSLPKNMEFRRRGCKMTIASCQSRTPAWERNPSSPVCLLDMLKVNAENYVYIGSTLHRIRSRMPLDNKLRYDENADIAERDVFLRATTFRHGFIVPTKT
jgi:hypothetical protein